MSEVASFPDEIIGMLAVVKDLTVPSSDLLDEDYAIADVIGDLERLYKRSKVMMELDALLVALRTEVAHHREDLADRLVVMNRMFAQRLGAA